MPLQTACSMAVTPFSAIFICNKFVHYYYLLCHKFMYYFYFYLWVKWLAPASDVSQLWQLRHVPASLSSIGQLPAQIRMAAVSELSTAQYRSVISMKSRSAPDLTAVDVISGRVPRMRIDRVWIVPPSPGSLNLRKWPSMATQRTKKENLWAPLTFSAVSWLIIPQACT